MELKYVPILKIYRALDNKYLSSCPFKKIWNKISPEG